MSIQAYKTLSVAPDQNTVEGDNLDLGHLPDISPPILDVNPNEQAAKLMNRLSGNPAPEDAVFDVASVAGAANVASTFLLPNPKVHVSEAEYKQAAMNVYEPLQEQVKQASENVERMIAASSMPPATKTLLRDANVGTSEAFSSRIESLAFLASVCWSIKVKGMGKEVGAMMLTHIIQQLAGAEKNFLRWVMQLVGLSNQHMKDYCQRTGEPTMEELTFTTGPVEMEETVQAPTTAAVAIMVLRRAQAREAQINKQEAAAGLIPNWALYVALGAAVVVLGTCAVVVAPEIIAGAAAVGAAASAALAQASAAAGALVAECAAAANAAMAPIVVATGAAASETAAAAGVAVVESSGAVGYVAAAAAGGGAAAVTMREVTRDDE